MTTSREAAQRRGLACSVLENMLTEGATVQTKAPLQHALEYAALGWRVIPVWWPISPGPGASCACGRGGCSVGKHPIGNEWEQRATTDEDQIAAWWNDQPLANVGVQLGPSSGIIDVENDSEDGLRFIQELIGDSGVMTPQFRSGKSVHLIFRWSDELAGLKANVRHRGAEFRLGSGDKGQQSVFPPSVHHSGRAYQWIVHPSECEVADVPPGMLAWLVNRGWENEPTRQRSTTIARVLEQQRIPDGERNHDLYAIACKKWGAAFRANGAKIFSDQAIELEVWMDCVAWNNQFCQPALPLDEVQTLFRSAREFILNDASRSTQATREQSLTSWGLEYRDNEWWPGLWKVKVIESDPAEVLLTTPFSMGIRMSMTDYLAPARVVDAVANQTSGGVMLDIYPGFWAAIWNGVAGNKKDERPPRIGLKTKLMQRKETVAAPFDMRRPALVADYLLNFLASAIPAASPTEMGSGDFARPVRTPDGRVWFRVSQAAAALKMADVRPAEVSRALKDAGIGDEQVGKSISRKRLKVAGEASIDALRRIAEIEPVSAAE